MRGIRNFYPEEPVYGNNPKFLGRQVLANDQTAPSSIMHLSMFFAGGGGMGAGCRITPGN